jgi:hypothetical protein
VARPKRFEPPTPRFVAWCHGQPVAIEPGLQRQSPENGNFPPGGRRLSANLRLRPRNRKRGDRPPECKSPPLAGLSLSRLVSSTVALPGCRSGVRSSGLEIAAATGLSCQQVQPENTELRPSWRREGDSNSWHGRAAVVIKPVSADSLRKTGIFADKAGDFRQFPPPNRRNGSLETKSNARKAGISGPFSRLLGSLAELRTGWLARQCRSHPSPRKFPANREFYREFCDFGPP